MNNKGNFLVDKLNQNLIKTSQKLIHTENIQDKTLNAIKEVNDKTSYIIEAESNYLICIEESTEKIKEIKSRIDNIKNDLRNVNQLLNTAKKIVNKV